MLWLPAAAALLCGLSAAPAAAQSVTLSVPAGTSLAEGVGSTDLLLTATLSEALGADTTVTLSLDGTARSTDYTVSSLPSITIAEGETTGRATVVLSPVDDNFHESPPRDRGGERQRDRADRDRRVRRPGGQRQMSITSTSVLASDSSSFG